MPAVALIAAVGTVSAGAALGGVLGGVMIAGGVMSGLGAVTGNKTLSTLGAVASLGAGLGSVMGLADTANSAWNAATAGNDALQVTGKGFFADGGVFGAAAGAATPVDSVMQMGAPQTMGLPSTDTATALGSGRFELAAPSGLENWSSGLGQSQLGASAPGGLISSSATPAWAAAAPNPMGTALQTTTPAENTATAGILPEPAYSQSTTDAALSSGNNGSFSSKALQFLKTNPELVKLGGGLIQGGMSRYSEQKKLEYQKALQDEARARYNASITGQR